MALLLGPRKQLFQLVLLFGQLLDGALFLLDPGILNFQQLISDCRRKALFFKETFGFGKFDSKFEIVFLGDVFFEIKSAFFKPLDFSESFVVFLSLLNVKRYLFVLFG